jgi:hypothetical protein
MIHFYKLIAEHGTFLLIGTEVQAKAFSQVYTDKGASLETWLNLGHYVLQKDELKEYDKAIIL